jgi:hypothetical protein
VTRRRLIADPERYTPMEWADACLTDWHGKTLPLRTVLMRLAEGCDHPDGAFAALQHSLACDLERKYHWGRGSIFACDDQAVVAYLPPLTVVGPFRSLNERANTWFRRHHGHGAVISTRIENWDRRMETLPGDLPAAVRQRLTEVTNLYLRVEQEAQAAPAVVFAERRAVEARVEAEHAVGVRLERAVAARAATLTEFDRVYTAQSRLARRRLLSLSVSVVSRL